MEKEKVLEIETQEVFDKVAIRIKYQNFEVLKRGEFEDREIKVKSAWAPQYVIYDDKLYIRGKETDEDNAIFFVDKKKLEKILEKVNEINEKYGIPKRWRAEELEEYYIIKSDGEIIEVDEEFLDFDDKHYKLGNYFKTKEEAQKVIDSKEWQEFWAKVKAGEIGNDY